jgi:hypothetical protein
MFIIHCFCSKLFLFYNFFFLFLIFHAFFKSLSYLLKLFLQIFLNFILHKFQTSGMLKDFLVYSLTNKGFILVILIVQISQKNNIHSFTKT